MGARCHSPGRPGQIARKSGTWEALPWARAAVTLSAMRGRVGLVAANAVSFAALSLVGWVIARPHLQRPAGIHGHLPHWSNLVLPVSCVVTGTVLLVLRPRNRV